MFSFIISTAVIIVIHVSSVTQSIICLTIYSSIITIIIIFTPWEFFTSALADCLSLDCEWQQVSPTLPSILAVLNNVIV